MSIDSISRDSIGIELAAMRGSHRSSSTMLSALACFKRGRTQTSLAVVVFLRR